MNELERESGSVWLQTPSYHHYAVLAGANQLFFPSAHSVLDKNLAEMNY